MTPQEPLALYHSWPLWERGSRLQLGCLHDAMPSPPTCATSSIGVWRCDLATGALDWSPLVHRLFALPLGRAIRRDDVLATYADESRSALERLRAHALRHRRGFTIDVLVRPHGAPARWVRINAAPRVAEGRPVELYGTKQDVTAHYR